MPCARTCAPSQSAGCPPAPIPDLQLLQPNAVLAREFVTVRKARTAGSKELQHVQAASGTLSDKELEMLRHSYTLMAAGDGPKVGLLPHQLRELVVMAGLDPAAEATRNLVEQLLARKDRKIGRIDFDNFMQTCCHFVETQEQEEEISPEYSQETGEPPGMMEETMQEGLPTVEEDGDWQSNPADIHDPDEVYKE